METPSFFSAFIAGLLTFLSPCILPLLPAYISFISGETLENLKDSSRSGLRLKAFLGAIFFGLGFSLVFIIFGAAATSIGKLFSANKQILIYIAGAVLIIFGLHLLGVFRIGLLAKQSRISYNKNGMPFFMQSFIFGVIFVLGWTPCVGPILSGILALAATKDAVYEGILLLFVYSIGLWIPFLISALMINEAMVLVRKISKYTIWIERFSGILLIIIGIMILSGNLSKITIFLFKIMPALPVY